MVPPNHQSKCWKCTVLLFWLSLGTEATQSGSGKDHVLAQNAFYGLHKHSCRCSKVSAKIYQILVVTNVCMDESFFWMVYNMNCVRWLFNICKHETWIL